MINYEDFLKVGAEATPKCKLVNLIFLTPLIVKLTQIELSFMFILLLLLIGKMQCIAFRLILSSCVSVCVSVYAAFVDLRKTV